MGHITGRRCRPAMPARKALRDPANGLRLKPEQRCEPATLRTCTVSAALPVPLTWLMHQSSYRLQTETEKQWAISFGEGI